MNNEDLNTDEIIIVGSRYGDLADVVTPFYEKGTPIEPEDIRKTLGCDEAVLMAVPNKHDAYAVGVFTLEEKRIGHVWMSQAPAVCRWLEQSKRDYVSVRIKRINTCCGLMIAEPVEALKLTPCERGAEAFDETWAANLPEILCSINEQSLSLGLALLRDELAEANCWSERLQLRIDNLLTKLPVDLSARYYRDSINLYKAMKNSKIAEVRQYSDIVLNAFVSRGSKNQMEWWVNEWLPDFFTEAAEGDLLGIFEADGYTLERVEELLLKAPNHLYHLYKVNRERFANHLYYSALPQTLYNRLLTLLAVREAMKKNNEEKKLCEKPEVEEVKDVAGECDELLANDVFSDELFTTNQQLLQLRTIINESVGMGEQEKIDLSKGLEWYWLYQSIYDAGLFETRSNRENVVTVVGFVRQIAKWLPDIIDKDDEERIRNICKSMSAEQGKWMMNGKPVNLVDIEANKRRMTAMKLTKIERIVRVAYNGLYTKLVALKQEILKEKATR